MVNGIAINDQSTTQVSTFIDFIQTIQQIEVYQGPGLPILVQTQLVTNIITTGDLKDYTNFQ